MNSLNQNTSLEQNLQQKILDLGLELAEVDQTCPARKNVSAVGVARHNILGRFAPEHRAGQTPAAAIAVAAVSLESIAVAGMSSDVTATDGSTNNNHKVVQTLHTQIHQLNLQVGALLQQQQQQQAAFPMTNPWQQQQQQQHQFMAVQQQKAFRMMPGRLVCLFFRRLAWRWRLAI